MSDESTFSTYAEIPALPVPRLEDTVRRYLESVAPLLEPAAYAETEAAAQELLAEGGQGRRLHAALEAKAANADNWLAEWWDDVAYLGAPDPVLINSSWGIWCDPRQPTDDPAARAAEVTARTVDYHISIVNETLPPDRAGKAQAPQDMSFFKRMFGVNRTPGAVKDSLAVYGPDVSRHVVAISGGRVFTLQVLDDDGRCMSVAELTRAFQSLIDAAEAEVAPEPRVAALTSERRPVWALERARLQADPANAATLEAIETALFGVYFTGESYDTFNAMARGGVHGRAGDRWMDKAFAYVVDARGRVSHHGEHSAFDALQPIAAFDYACDKAQRGVFRAEPAEQKLRDDRPTPQRRNWALSAESRAAIDAAVARFDAQVADFDLEILAFDGFGKNLIKTFKTGPDPFVQMAYQLAYHRLHGRFPKTYESAATRGFRLGRTETIRPVTRESTAFIEAMLDPNSAPADRIAKGRAAFETHGRLGAEATAAQGCDRHLLGLKLIAAALGEEPPKVLTEEIFTRGWELTTAQIPVKSMMQNTFGPVMPSGYGIGYVIRGDDLSCSVVAHTSHPDTSAKRFAAAIRAALEDLRTLFASEAA
ncbi:MAG: choline/carnitine O-acyltransferase [Pseudomonadota bacterium]